MPVQRKQLILLLIVALAVTSGCATRNLYFGVTGGITDNADHLSSNDDGSLSNIDNDDEDKQWSVIVGTQSSKFFGFEASYTDLGESFFSADSAGGPSWSAGPVTALHEADGYGVSAVSAFPLSRRLTAFARYGLFWWETREVFENSLIPNDEDSGSGSTYAAGLEFDPGQQDAFVFRAETSRHDVDDDGNEVESISAGILFHF